MKILFLWLVLFLTVHTSAWADSSEMPKLPGYSEAEHFKKFGIGFLHFDTLANGICVRYDEAARKCNPPYVSVPVAVYKDTYLNAEKTGEIQFQINHGTDYYFTDASGKKDTALPWLKGMFTGAIALPVYEVRYCNLENVDTCEYDKHKEGIVIWYQTPHGWITLPKQFSKGAKFYSWPEFFASYAFAGRLSESIYPIITENNFHSIYPLPLCSYGYYDGWCSNNGSSFTKNQLIGSTWDEKGQSYPLIGIQVYEQWMLVLVDENNSYKNRLCLNGKAVPPRGKLGWVKMYDNKGSTLLVGDDPLSCP